MLQRGFSVSNVSIHKIGNVHKPPNSLLYHRVSLEASQSFVSIIMKSVYTASPELQMAKASRDICEQL